MPTFIVKLTDQANQDFYLEYSTIVDAPITFGMSLEEFKEYYQEEYGRRSMQELDERLKRLEKNDTSSMVGETAKNMLKGNRAGKGETELSIDQIIEYYCHKRDDSIEKPVGKSWVVDE